MNFSESSTQRRYPQQGQPPRKEAVAKGHDAVLRALQNDGRKITVFTITGKTFTGKVVGRDKFTITVLDADGIRAVIYKHAIELFFGAERTTE